MNTCREKRFLILYGSQTGQAEAISEQIRDRALSKGLSPNLHCLDQSEKKFFLEKEKVFVVVVSTTGEGDPPDNVGRFWRRLKKKTLPGSYLCGCSYALLGLGDTNYTNFCNMGKMLNKRLLELGAKQFYPPGFADDGVGLDIVVEPWIEGLWGALEKVFVPSVVADSESSSMDITSEAHGAADHHRNNSNNITTANPNRTVNSTVDNPNSTVDNPNSTVDNPNNTVDNPNSTADNPNNIVDNPNNIVDNPNSTVDNPNTTVDNPNNTVDNPNSTVDNPNSTPNRTANISDPHCSSHEADMRSEKLASNVKKLQISSLPLPSPILSNPDPNSQEQPLADHGVIDKARRNALRLRSCRSCEPDEATLTLPSLPPAYITVQLNEAFGPVPEFPYCKISHALKTTVSMATILGSRLLTKEAATKKTREMELMVPGLTYEPGDAFGVMCPNPEGEVQWLLQRLCLAREADKMMTLLVVEGTAKKNASLPKHIPSLCSMRQFFTHCVNIRAIPKKAHLNLWATFCNNDEDNYRLKELSSKQGSSEYSSLFTEKRTNFLDILHAFPSCFPPLSRLIEVLPKLQSRYYSVASSPSFSPGCLKIAFNVEHLPARFWESNLLESKRLGLASGWLDRTAEQMHITERAFKVPVFSRQINPFHLPKDTSQPIIMIGPGTGVAPFIGFLQHREAILLQHNNDLSMSTARNLVVSHGGCITISHEEDISAALSRNPPLPLSKAWLLFGCRDSNDHIYREEMEHFVKIGCLNCVHVAYSRVNLFLNEPEINSSGQASQLQLSQADQLNYVQDLMRLYWEQLASWLLEEQACVYVCGDAKNMVKDVNSALVDVMGKYLQSRGRTISSVEELIQSMKNDGRYLIDAWT